MHRVQLALFWLSSWVASACSYTPDEDGSRRGPVDSGVTALWILSNISYAGMRAQNHASAGWRVLAFIFGFPGTLVSFLAVKEGSSRAYGITLPAVPTLPRPQRGGEEPPPQ